MTDTDWREPGQQVPNLAHGYTRVDEEGNPVDRPGAPQPGSAPARLQKASERVPGNPSGGAASTVTDLLRFTQALQQHRLLSAEFTDVVTTGKVPAPRPGGPADDRYAYGFDDSRLHGVRIVGHNGGATGAGAQVDMYPDLGYTVV